MKRFLIALVGLVSLAACSMAPITIDVIPLLDGSETGSGQIIVSSGGFDVYLPDSDGQVVSGYRALEVQPAAVSLDYELDLRQDGSLSGSAEVAFYMAAPGDYLWVSDNQLGDPQTVDFGQAAQTVMGTLSLSAEQIDALMAGEFVVGARISGTADDVPEDGSVNIEYEFKKLMLEVTFF